MSEKRCDVCGKQPATVRYTEIDEGQVSKKALCRVCATARGILDEPPKSVLTLQQLLTVSAAPTAKPAPEGRAAPDLVCSGCGLSFAAFRKQGRLGCAACYTAFESELLPLLRKLHAHVRHAGKAPHAYARKAELRARVEDLRGELERAVRAEDYERAAHVRDELRGVEQQQTQAARQAGPAAAGEGSEHA